MLLYHYTTVDALKSIIERKRIRLSGISYLNDSKEGFEFIDVAMNECIKSENDKKKFEGFLRCATYTYKIYLASFSEEEDLLSQWRGYCPPEGGVAIGFDFEQLKSAKIYGKKEKFKEKKLEKSLQDSISIGKDFFLTKCFYYENKDKEPYELIKEVCKLIIEKLNSMPDEHITALRGKNSILFPLVYPDILSLLGATAKVLSSIKNKSFQEEKEYRIVFNTNENTLKPYYKSKSNLLIPFVELEFEPGSVIKDVKIGPSPNQELMYYSIQRFLYVNDLKINPSVSFTPFRNFQ